MKNKLEDLRNHLFLVIENLNDPDTPMDIQRANTIASVAQTIINSAKVEVEFLKVTENKAGSKFFREYPVGAEPPPAQLPKAGGKKA